MALKEDAPTLVPADPSLFALWEGLDRDLSGWMRESSAAWVHSALVGVNDRFSPV